MIATLHIQVALRNNISYLKTVYNTPPFKVADITEDKFSNPLKLMVMSSSPGILDGDEYAVTIDIDKDCALRLHTQSYQRLFHMKKTASQQTVIHLKEGASFCYIPHPTVPHELSSFSIKTDIYLEKNCSLLYGEILTAGRNTNGEVFTFTKYHTITNVYIENRLVVKENLLMQPALVNIQAIGQLEGFTHQASLIYLNEQVNIKLIYDTLVELTTVQKDFFTDDVVTGISVIPGNGLIVRLLGYKAEKLFNCLKLLAGHLPLTVSCKTMAYAI